MLGQSKLGTSFMGSSGQSKKLNPVQSPYSRCDKTCTTLVQTFKTSPFYYRYSRKFLPCYGPRKPLWCSNICLLTCFFFCIAHLEEFTVSAISKFDPSKYIMRNNFTLTHNHEGQAKKLNASLMSSIPTLTQKGPFVGVDDFTLLTCLCYHWAN